MFSKIYLSIFFSLFLLVSANAQKREAGKYESVFSGYVRSNYTAKPIIGATVYFKSLGKGTATDIDGYFEIIVPNGTFQIQFGSVGMTTEVLVIDIIKDISMNVELKETTLNLEEVTVFAEKQDANVKSLDVGKTELDISKINQIPSFMGEPDVIKGLMLLPGVTTVGEGASGFNVRGGSVDQNLILQDGALIFNPSHVFGFFSVFNASVVKNVSLYKSGIPSKYGGRLSSVLSVDLKEGDMKEFKAEGGVGLVSSKLAISTPIVKDKLALIVGGRASYADWMLKQAKSLQVKQSTATFQDVNAKLTYVINDNNKVSLSSYVSHDGFGLASDTTFSWTTINNVLNWNHIINDESGFVVNAVKGSYDYNIEDEEGLDGFTLKSKIDYEKINFDYENQLTLKSNLFLGAEFIHYQFKPGHREALGENSGVKEVILETEQSREFGIYVENEFNFNERFSVRAGLRYNMFQNVGAGTDYIYGENGPHNIDNLVDSVSYGKGDIIAQYQGLEPRVNFNYELSTSSSMKMSYNRTRQNLHLISNTAAVSPTDIWKTSNKYIEPEVADQFSLGYFRNFKDNSIETSVEAYYKKGQNVVDFKNGKSLVINDDENKNSEVIESNLITGSSEAYGIEFYVKKKTGAWTGWMSYTLSRSWKTINGEFDEEKISRGLRFPANFDKPHDFTFVMDYKANPLVSYGANFTYSTGRPTTAPQAIYDLGLLTSVYTYSLRNELRIPDYHRLDVSMTVKSKPRIDRKWRMSWTLAVYNLYGRKNAYSVYYTNEKGSPPSSYKLSVLGSAFPSLMVNFNF